MTSVRTERDWAAAEERRDRLRIGLAAGVVVAAVAGLLALAGGRPFPAGRSAYDAGTTDPVAAAVPVLAGFADQARELRFRTPPATLPAADRAAVQRLGQPSPRTYGELERGFAATVGREFATALADHGGNAAVDGAFTRPPVDGAGHRPTRVGGRRRAVRDLAGWVAARRGRAEVTRSAERGLRPRSCA